jgi:hypothetical protein
MQKSINIFLIFCAEKSSKVFTVQQMNFDSAVSVTDRITGETGRGAAAG